MKKIISIIVRALMPRKSDKLLGKEQHESSRSNKMNFYFYLPPVKVNASTNP